MEKTRFDIAVIGGGLAGSLAALGLAEQGYDILFIARETLKRDHRTTALMDQSIAYLDRLGLWQDIAPLSAALSTMQIIDGTDRLLRAPIVAFRASEIDLPAFGYNIPNHRLAEVLDAKLENNPRIHQIRDHVSSLTMTDNGNDLITGNGARFAADFIVGADGRESLVRQTAGIEVRRWTYPQTALVLDFAHTAPHGNVSTEFHTRSGPFTQVPLPGDRSSLVWVLPPQEAERLAAEPLEALSRAVETRMQSMLGKVTIEQPPQTWPLSGMTAKRFGHKRMALIGEAAHVFPPIGAQGLNLSLRDIMTLGELLGPKVEGHALSTLGDRFHSRRNADIVSRTASVDLLNRSLLSEFLPVQMLRAAGLSFLGTVTPFKNLIMREGIAPGSGFKALPSILRSALTPLRSGRSS